MPRSISLRAVALSLALAVTGQVTTPAIDALLYHQGIELQLGAHWDPAGGCQSHADHCQLGAPQGGPPVVAPRVAPVASTSGPGDRLAQHVPDAFHPDPSTPLHHSRAPPALEG